MPIYLNYYFWLVAVSLFFLVLERIKPWHKEQEVIREGFVQDLFWLVFNQQYLAWMLAIGVVKVVSLLDGALASIGMIGVSDLKLLSDWPLYAQFLVAFVVTDFIGWYVHRLLHTVPWLWEFHKLHHSIRELDWLGAFRSHWGDIITHRLFRFLPMVVLGVDDRVVVAIAIAGVVIQEVSHSNLKLDWGILRYVLNSPRFHAWHHDVKMYGKGGQNFAISLTLWDWLFRTAYWPSDKLEPDRLGFKGMYKFPQKLIGRLLYPIIKLKNKKPQRD